MSDQTLAPENAGGQALDAAPDGPDALKQVEQPSGQAANAPKAESAGQANEGAAKGGTDMELPEGFKDVGSLIKSYTHLRKELTKMKMEAAELRKGQTAKGTREDGQKDAGLDVADDVAVQAAIERVLEARMGPLQNLLAQQEKLTEQQRTLAFNTQVWELTQQYGREFAMLSPQVHEVVKERPELLDMDRGLELAFFIARGKASQAANQAVLESMANDFFNTNKIKATATGGGSKDVRQQDHASWEEEEFQKILNATG